MKFSTFTKMVILFCFLAGIGKGYTQNIIVTSAQNQNPNTLINDHLAGEGVILSEGKFNNNATTITSPQIGTFNRNGFTNLPFQSGLIMTTGNVNVAPGPNSEAGKSSPVANAYSDPQLNSLATSSLHACSVLDFDFIAMADTFAFEYVFASEEYPEYVCSSYNDVFAFFLTGIDPVTFTTTTKNVAIIPNTITAANPTGIPVAINTINNGVPMGSASGCHTQYSAYYNANPSGASGIEYDGFTTALTAEATILACQTYHMHLAVGNIGDNAYDSGVFLKEGSFYSPSLDIVKHYSTPGHGDTLIQYCRDLDLEFTLPRPNMTAYTTYITFAGDAVNGTDYSLVTENGLTLTTNNNSFSFQNDTLATAHMTILPTANFNNSDTKQVILYIETVFCEFIEGGRTIDTIYLYLRRNDSIQLVDTTINACHQCDHVNIELLSGTEPLYYTWTPATDIANPNAQESAANITSGRTYTVIARDQYHCLADTAEVRIVIQEQPEATPIVTPQYGCAPLTIDLNQPNSPVNCKYAWMLTNDTLELHPDSVAQTQVTLTDAGYYDIYLWMSSAPGCNDSILVQNAVHVSDFPHADFTFAPDEPQNGQEVMFYDQSTGDNIVSYNWSFGDGTSSSEMSPIHAYHLENSDNMNVRLLVTNQDGCSDDTTAVVPVVDNFAFWVPNAFSPNSDGRNEVFLPQVTDVAYYQFDIYTRTGELFFSTRNTEQGWDGTVNGKLAPMDVYVWKIQYAKYANPSEIIVKTGMLNLIR